jgi:hypothetical protein
VFGQRSDGQIYRDMRDQNIPAFLDLADGLAAHFSENCIDLVAGDAAEGFNPTHDLCRALVNAAVSIAERARGKRIANYEFCLTEWEQHCREVHDERCLHLRLDDALLEAKLEAAVRYAELKDEVEQAIAAKGREYFRIECLRRVHDPFPELAEDEKPYYETFGERRVAEGKYPAVIRYREHMLPLLQAIRDHARQGTAKPAALSAAAGRP